MPERYWLIGNVSDFNSTSTSGWVKIDHNYTQQVGSIGSNYGWSEHGFKDYSWNANDSGKLQPTYSQYNNENARLMIYIRFWTEYELSGNGFKLCSGITKACDAYTNSLAIDDWDWDGPTPSGKICYFDHYTWWDGVDFFGYSSLNDPTITHTNANFWGHNIKPATGQTFYAYIAAYIDFQPGCYVTLLHPSPTGSPEVIGYNEGTSIDFSTNQYNGYEFINWHSGGTINGSVVTSASAGRQDQIYYGEWRKLYNLIFYGINNNIYDQTSVIKKPAGTTSSSMTLPSPLSMDGYVFKGWKRTHDSGKSYSIITTDDAFYYPETISDSQSYGNATANGFPIYYYPVFAKVYNVIFKDASGNTITTSNTKKYVGDSVSVPSLTTTNLNLLTPTGYYFIGWTQTKDEGKNYQIVYSGTRDNTVPDVSDSQLSGIGSGTATANGFEIIYYPKLLKRYRIVYYNTDGEIWDQTTHINKLVGTTGTTLTLTSNPTLSGYVFKGWTRTPDTGVTWKAINTNASLSYPEDIADDQADQNNATSDGFAIYYYPIFAKVYTIIFKDKNGNILTNNNTLKYVGDAVDVPSLTTANLNLLTDTGYYFIGWSQTKSTGKNYLISHSGIRDGSVPNVADSQLSGTGSGTATTDGFEIIYYPDLLKRYKIIFYNSDGSINTTLLNKIKDDSVITPSAITRANYVFKGWIKATGNQLYQNVTVSNIKAASTSITVEQDSENGSVTTDGFEIKYYGVWNPLYSITYKNGTDTIYTDTNAAERNTDYTVLAITNANFTNLKNNNPSKQLLGWGTSSSSTSPTVTINSITANATLYAIWRDRDSLIFQENGTTITDATDGTITGTYGNFTVNGYAAMSNGVYYYDKDASQDCTYLLNTTNTTGKSKC